MDTGQTNKQNERGLNMVTDIREITDKSLKNNFIPILQSVKLTRHVSIGITICPAYTWILPGDGE